MIIYVSLTVLTLGTTTSGRRRGRPIAAGFTHSAFHRIDIDREHFFLDGTCNQVVPGLKSAIRG